MLWRTKAADSSPGITRDALGPNAFQQAPIVVLAVGAAAAGVLALPPAGSALTRALRGTASPPATALELLGSAALAVIVVAAVAHWWVPEPRWAGGWLGLEQVAHLLVVRPTFGLARILARFDDRVLDRAVEATAIHSLRAAHRLAHTDIRAVDGAVEAVAGWMRGLGELARRPQTGQLHQYYLAAVVVLAFGAVVLVVAR